MWFGEPHPFPQRGSPTTLSASVQQSYEGWSCRKSNFFSAALYCICSLSGLSRFLFYLKKRKVNRKKFIKTNLFWFSQQVRPQNASLEAKFNLIWTVMCTDLRVRSPPSCQIWMRLEFSRQNFSKIMYISNFMKNCSMEGGRDSWKEL
jgi:hypothetical protein